MIIKREQASHLFRVIEYYGCSEEEAQLVKEAYKRDPEAAAESFALMAAEIERRAPRGEVRHSVRGDVFLRVGQVDSKQREQGDGQ